LAEVILDQASEPITRSLCCADEEFIRTHPSMQFFGIAEPGATRRGAFFLFGIVIRKYNYSPADVAFDL
jgi:hypothetical protein